ncbi:hypothetical protein BDW62DRAFT_208536 [Aspergillus aurantiobrunneus]
MPTPELTFQCQFPDCGRSYRRKEHLNRHARCHFQTMSYQFPFCNRSFAKKQRINRRPPVSSTQLIPVPDSDLTCRNLPYIHAYFEKFHPSWPFLHQATFDPDHEPVFLLRSVVMMGLWVIGDENSQRAAMTLHDKLTLSIYQQRVSPNPHLALVPQRQYQDDTFESVSWPMASYQGILLHIIFALLTSKDQVDLQLTHALPSTPTQLLVALVHSCLKQHMFFYPSMLAQFTSTSVPEVYIWLGIEEVKRFTLTLYKVCRRCRGGCLLSLADLQFALPNSDELWHAGSDLAAQVAENRSAYRNKNIEANWISQTSRLLQPNEGFHWI